MLIRSILLSRFQKYLSIYAGDLFVCVSDVCPGNEAKLSNVYLNNKILYGYKWVTPLWITIFIT